MDKERIVGSSEQWEDIKTIFRQLGLTISSRNDHQEYISHGILLLNGGCGLFLRMKRSYEYRNILEGNYTGAKLYHYIALLSDEERILLLEHPFIQWRAIYPERNMPGDIYRRFRNLQAVLPTLYELIPSAGPSSLLSLPKGRANAGESSKDAACRELYEEAGVKIDPAILGIPYIDITIGTDGNRYITYVYGVSVLSRPELVCSDEFESAIWESCTSNLLLRYQKLLLTFLSSLNATREVSRRKEEGKGDSEPEKEGSIDRVPAS